MAEQEAAEELEGESRREKKTECPNCGGQIDIDLDNHHVCTACGAAGYKKEETPKALPIVKYEGKLWIFDEKLRQLRNLYNPHDFQNLNDFEVDFFSKNMSIPIPVYDFDGEWAEEDLVIEEGSHEWRKPEVEP